MPNFYTNKLAILVSIFAATSVSFVSGMITDRPNIVLIMSDDHAAHMVGSYGSNRAQTPHIDRLASQGIQFDRAFVTMSLCSPSRAAVLSGKYGHLNGLKTNGDGPFDNTQPTFPKHLQAAGYQTAVFGKWHLFSEPTGFDHYSLIPGHGRFWDSPFMEPDDAWHEGSIYAKEWSEEDIKKGYLTDVITDETIKWIDQVKDSDEPFMVMVQHKTPHTKHKYPVGYEELFTAEIPEPETFDDDYAGRLSLLNYDSKWSKMTNVNRGDIVGNIIRKGSQIKATDDPDYKTWAYQVFARGYLRLVSSLDDNVGRLVEYLDESGLSENTIVIYTSDNGFFIGEHGLYNKMWMYEESLRVPLIVRFPPHIEHDIHSDEIVSLLDIAPTLLDYAGADIPDDLQGQSLRPLLENESEQWTAREAHYYHYYDQQFGIPNHIGVRTEQHKIICFYLLEGAARWELFDLANDPHELNNLAGDPARAELKAKMIEILKGRAKHYEDPVLSKI